MVLRLEIKWLKEKHVYKVAVLGCGNMPQALLKKADGFKFFTYTPSSDRAEVLAKQLDGEVITSLKDISEVDIVLLACKPQQFNELAQDIKSLLKPEMFVISMLAGVDLESLQDGLAHKNTVRIMPNITAKIGKGSLLIYPELTDENSAKMAFLKELSAFYPLANETAFDELMLVTGSGPAYIFYLVRSIEKYLENKGHNASLYREAILDTFSGALDIMKNESDLSSSQLIERVASKGGVTQEALAYFSEHNFDAIVEGGLIKGVKRSKALQDAVRK